MNHEPLSNGEKRLFKKYFEDEIEDIAFEEFKKKRKALVAKYHPDKFEKHQDELVKEMALDKYHEIEEISERAQDYLNNKDRIQTSVTPSNSMVNKPQFGFDGLFIEIITRDKNLKYEMFGSYYKYLEFGDKYEIPGTNASIGINSKHIGNTVGFNETIKIYLSFGPEDSIEEIIDWLYEKIEQRAEALIIEKTRIPVNRDSMSQFIKKKTLLLGN